MGHTRAEQPPFVKARLPALRTRRREARTGDVLAEAAVVGVGFRVVGAQERRLGAALLRDVNVVDTPGTNVILERQQRLTEEYVPRADLVLFVISADRPFTESEVEFLKYIRCRPWARCPGCCCAFQLRSFRKDLSTISSQPSLKPG